MLDSSSKLNRANLIKLLSHLISTKALSIAVLRVSQWVYAHRILGLCSTSEIILYTRDPIPCILGACLYNYACVNLG